MRVKRADPEHRNLHHSKRIYHDADHLPKERMSEPSICTDCKAAFVNGHWTFDDEFLTADGIKVVKPEPVICPACEQIRNGVPLGFLYIRGKFATDHAKEIANLINNETDRMSHENPLWRIMTWEAGAPELTITTTTPHLAQHLGRALRNAYDGEVHYSFSEEHAMARVYWERN